MPRLDFWFRLFHHAALALASVCLLYAEAFFLPTPLLACLYGLAALQVLAFGADGRRWVLPAWAANVLAGAVAGGGAAWIAMELNAPDSVLADLPLPAGLLPYIGPILIGLLVVKLFRPRTARDFWLLQGVGALQVALACVLATNPDTGLLFALLLAAYIACVLGCLALHHLQEQQGAEKPPDRLPFAGRMAPFCLRWTLAVAALAVPLFLLTPRIDGPTWDSSALTATGLRGGTAQVGFSQKIDLNRDGPVRLGGWEAFRVAVVAAPGQTAPPVPAGQRWRGGVLDTYSRGVWTNWATTQQPDLGLRQPPPFAPPLQEGSYRLDFTVEAQAANFFLAEPVRTNGDRGRRTRVESGSPDSPTAQFISSRGPVLPKLYNGPHEYRYRQTVGANDDPDRSPPGDVGVLDVNVLVESNVPGLAEWTAALLKRLAADPAYDLKPADIQRGAGTTAATRQLGWAAVGRALGAYLARSGEYGYTLDLRRQDPYVDPVMDFLVNVKAGHCERFASALALMLRSQGVPSRVVVGYRGAGERDDNGVYVVRENQAHAWVEMLALDPTAQPNPLGGLQQMQWVTLDPTPAAELPPPAPYSLWDWWQDGQRTGQELWGGMIVNYNAEEQAGLLADAQSPRVLTALAGMGLGLAALAGVGAFAWVGVRRRGRARRAGPGAVAPAASGYARLAALLARRGGPRAETGQTPREFAAGARRFLLSLPAAAPLADLPDEIVDRLYRMRFGGQAIGAAERAAGEARLDLLAAALAGARTHSGPAPSLA